MSTNPETSPSQSPSSSAGSGSAAPSDWERSAGAWIAEQDAGGSDRGDWARAHVLDPAMLARIETHPPRRALDVGCGEGRFCRVLRSRGIDAIGIEPTPSLLAEARRRDPGGDYRSGRAEALDVADGAFDLVVSYLTLIDIAPFEAAIAEMARVLAPGGALLVANLASFVTPCMAEGWARDARGTPLHYPLDRYLDAAPVRATWAGIDVVNWHRPLSAYMGAFLAAGLRLAHFDEPPAIGATPERAARHRRVPWFVVMEWRKSSGMEWRKSSGMEWRRP